MGQHPVLIRVENIVALLGRELVVLEARGDQGQASPGRARQVHMGVSRQPYTRGTPLPRRGEAADVEGEGFAREEAEGLRIAFHLPQTSMLSDAEMRSGSEAGSYLRLIDVVYHSTLGLGVMKKKK